MEAVDRVTWAVGLVTLIVLLVALALAIHFSASLAEHTRRQGQFDEQRAPPPEEDDAAERNDAA